ncbi:serine/threonine protein kinase, partial [Nostoc sp. NIES-2111]
IEAIEHYDRAISLARDNEYINEEALANELAAKFYLAWGKQKIAQTYLMDAYYGYSRWGAKAKVDDLTQRYPQLLAPILQQEKLNLQSTNTISSNRLNLTLQPTVIGSKTGISDSLDLASVIKAYQALSGIIDLEQLLSTLMQVVMENAGASKSALILSENDNLTVMAVSSIINIADVFTQFPSTYLESSYDVPITLINYVKRSLDILVIDDANMPNFLAGDRYIIREQPQ